MKDCKEIFEGKKITQMGLGLLGGGAGDAEYLLENGAEVIITDLKTREQLKSSVDMLTRFPKVTYRLGEHREEDFIDRDFILKGPSVPKVSRCIETARKEGVPVDMSASLFCRIAQMPIIGVTGTRGKSTVVHLLNQMLEKDGRNVLLGGNVQGSSSLRQLDEVGTDSVGLLELDSWKCQGFGEKKSINHPKVLQGAHSPQLAVFTTFMPDHLNYYKGDMDAYLADKANIFLHQERGDIFVVGKQALPALKKYTSKIKSEVIVADGETVPKDWKVGLVGEHNRYNAGIAVAVAQAFGIDEEVIKEVVENIEALPGRLEFVSEVKGVQFYNDTNATTPEAVIAALKALSEKGSIQLIAGGTDKELDSSALLPAIEEQVEQVVFLSGTGTSRLLEGRSDFQVSKSLEDAFMQVTKNAREGSIVLLSPGFSSFGMFTNEYDRGAQFNKLVKNL